jgi:hypothetical protein
LEFEVVGFAVGSWLLLLVELLKLVNVGGFNRGVFVEEVVEVGFECTGVNCARREAPRDMDSELRGSR